jgi:acyl-CoA synthetase (AMP-forming)/AMP-acid ligase II
VAYGQTEAGGTVSSTLVRAGAAPAPRASVGRALPGIELRFDEAGAEQGVLYLRSPAVAAEYFHRPEQSAGRFHDGWLKTNDVLRRDADGWLYFLGRADDMYLCGGENVYPAQVEARLLSHPQVAQAVVVPAPDRIKGQVAFAFVVLRATGAVSASDLQAHAARGAPSHLHAQRLQLLDAMPLSATNKVDLARLRQMALEQSP